MPPRRAAAARPPLDERADPTAASGPSVADDERRTGHKRARSPTRGESASPPPSRAPKVSLASWLSSSTGSADLQQLPMPTTCDAAHIEDRHSVFLGFVYPLTTPSPTRIAALLDHLTHVVHPALPPTKLPAALAGVSATKRGSTHDMYAYRVLQLKPGRTGRGGPNDFGVEQGQEDDGEAWGADKVARVIRELGASDVLVIVSRWYGGELLGPVRFDHITRVARAALQAHLDQEALQERRAQLQQLDREIAAARGAPASAVPAYEALTPERAQRLCLAKQKTLHLLKKSVPPRGPRHDGTSAEP